MLRKGKCVSFEIYLEHSTVSNKVLGMKMNFATGIKCLSVYHKSMHNDMIVNFKIPDESLLIYTPTYSN